MRTFWIGGALLALTASCGSSSSSDNPATDSGADATLDAADGATDSRADAPLDAPADAIADGDANVPVGTHLADGLLRGVTTDDFAIVDDGTKLVAAPIGGGALQSIASEGTAPIVFALWGKTMLANLAAPSGGTSREFWIWTSTHGAVKLASATTSFQQFVNPVSPDETHVAYVTNPSATTGDVTVANVDGTGVTTLLAGAGVPQEMMWAGDHFLLVLRANTAGGSTFTVSAFDANASWAKVDLATNVAGIGYNAHGTSVAIRDDVGNLNAYPLTGGAPTLLDTGATIGTFMLDDATVIYATAAGALKRIAITGGTPATLVTSGFATQGDFFSPDAKTMVYVQPATGALHDLAVVALAPSSTPVVLTGTRSNGSEPLPQYFTTDSTMIMFPGDLASPLPGHPLYAAPVSGAPIKTIGTSTNGARWGVGGTKIVFADDAVTGDGLGYGTLKTVDLASSAAPTTIVTNAGLFSAPSADRKSIVYTAIGPKGDFSDSAVFVTPIP
jgi:hypothetical protein